MNQKIRHPRPAQPGLRQDHPIDPGGQALQWPKERKERQGTGQIIRIESDVIAAEALAPAVEEIVAASEGVAKGRIEGGELLVHVEHEERVIASRGDPAACEKIERSGPSKTWSNDLPAAIAIAVSLLPLAFLK